MTWDEFKEEYEPTLGRRSVNYTTWLIVEQSEIDWWFDMLAGGDTRKRFKKEKLHIFKALDYSTKQTIDVECEYGVGNIEDVFGGELFGQQIPTPFIKVGCNLDGFGIFKYNNLLGWQNNVSIKLVDNDHWPALQRGTCILISKNIVPKEIYERVSE